MEAIYFFEIQRRALLATRFLLVYLNLKMEKMCSSETSVDFYQTTRYYNRELVATVTAVNPAKINVWSIQVHNDFEFRNDLCGEFYSTFMGKPFKLL